MTCRSVLKGWLNMELSRIKILTVDRPKMTYDITSVFVSHNVNIIWMEVYTYVVYIKFQQLQSEVWRKMKKELQAISGVKEVSEVDFIVLEEKELEVQTVLNSIAQGIVIVDKNFDVKYLNNHAAQHIFQTPKGKMIGRSINHLDKNNRIKEILGAVDDKKEVHRMEVEINFKNYLVTANPIVSDDEKLSAFMVTFEDMNRIGEIFNLKRYDNPITFDDIYGVSRQLKMSINQAVTYSRSDSPVLILGESGTGKELFARAMHNESDRSSRLFVALNCAAIPDQLLESELFGYEEGAFTGGKKNGKTGILEIADGGTVFLDEIGEMPPHLQAKLLRVLQENKIRKLGSNKEIPINVRILTATNRDINSMVASNQFRLDLFYRINVFTLTIPPLRDRIEDIDMLVKAFIKIYANKYHKKNMSIHQDALESLRRHHWPGNVRELQNVIERAIAISDKGMITDDTIIYNELPVKNAADYQQPLKQTMERVERDLIMNALKGKKSIRETAKKLGVTHTLLINRMKKYKIAFPVERN